MGSRVVLAGLVAVAVFFSGCKSKKEKEEEEIAAYFSADVPAYVAYWDAPHCTPARGTGKCQVGSIVFGKVLVVDVDRQAVDPTQRKLDDRVRAYTKEDVRSVALVRYSEASGGMYVDTRTNKPADVGKSVDVVAEVRVIDVTTGKRTSLMRVTGFAPGFVVGDKDSVHKGSPPHDQIARELLLHMALPK